MSMSSSSPHRPQSSDSSSSVPPDGEVVDSQEVTAENAAAILAADDGIDDPDANETDQTHRGMPSRRTLLTIGGIAAAAVVGTSAFLTIRRTNQGVIGAHEALPLVIGGDICAAPLYAAYHQGFFDDAGLKVTLARTQQTEDTKDGVGAGKYIGAPGIFFSWLEPIYNGLNARLTAGLHAGCLRLVVGKDSPYQKLADLKGATIGVPSLSSSAFAYFAIGLSEAGINVNPDGGDITWRTIDADSLGTALTDGQVDAVMGSDPGPLLPVFKGKARELANNDAEEFCCSVALNGGLRTSAAQGGQGSDRGMAEGLGLRARPHRGDRQDRGRQRLRRRGPGRRRPGAQDIRVQCLGLEVPSRDRTRHREVQGNRLHLIRRLRPEADRHRRRRPRHQGLTDHAH